MDYSNRITADNIKKLQLGEVFVFGSNESGIQSQLKGVVKKYKGYEFKLVQ